ncbi:MAG: methyltransferase domain-containing protein [Chloroflexi bacterium]|nr:methyltransferase domain-containing protein [Chloroflexota bacterium]
MVEIDWALYEEWRRIARVNPGYVARLPHRYEGETGEEFFEERLGEALRPGCRALDLGCGGGEFTIRMAQASPETRIVGLDPFAEMLTYARGLAGHQAVSWLRALGEALPFGDAAFDVVYSRRGPASEPRVLPEAARVLRPGGRFLEVTIGERNAWEFAEIFGRGQMAGVTEKRSVTLRRRLREHGLRTVLVRDFLSRHILLGGVDELAQALEGSPAVPDVDRRRDAAALAEAAQRLKVADGIASTNHRVVLEAVKG